MMEHGQLDISSLIEVRVHMLWTFIIVLIVLWLLGFSFHVAGGLIHILLVVALVTLVYNLIRGSR
jgi:small-conductance mechanosensitive channel